QSKKRCVLTLHINPDPDSIGSNLALAHVLEALGHSVTVYSQDAVSHEFSFLDGFANIHILPVKDIPWKDFDIYWALDMAQADRMGAENIPSELTTLVIDHHSSNTGWGTINITQSNQPSTSSILLHIFKELDLSVDAKAAQCLLTGICGDTGFFQYAVNPEVHEDAAYLMKQGADYAQITAELLNNIPLPDLVFMGSALQRATIYPEKSCVIIDVPYDIWKAHGESPLKRVFLVRYLSQIKDTKFGVVLSEEQPGKVRVSMRSHGDAYDVGALAAKLGGGGHVRAAGGNLGMSLADAITTVLEAI
ncbi:bifunctional oligoribonuclease/PAP phosphatase NrnA, partial [Candidatus Woesebacteria bacterium]|nr:bifunctional oligoribonuclease/PAP phosphatase NrnA [Candidatus Woesebacteria bacterium]